jgi:hypothetical protein
MISTLFCSRLRPDATDYAHVARETLERARGMPGFVSFKAFQHEHVQDSFSLHARSVTWNTWNSGQF